MFNQFWIPGRLKMRPLMGPQDGITLI